MAEGTVFETREQVQSYLQTLAEELKLPVEDSAVAAELDKRDKVSNFRSRFEMPTIGSMLDEDERDPGVDVSEEPIYFSGNSLGLLPKGTRMLVQQELDKWGSRALCGHFKGTYPWYPIEDFVAEKSANVVGCKKEEVTAMNSLTANIHFALAYERKIQSDNGGEGLPLRYGKFAVQSQIRLHGFDPKTALVLVPSIEGELIWRTEDVVKVIEEHASSTALVFLSGIHYATGHLFDIKTITAVAHKLGIYAGFDLAHAAGNVQLHLHDWDVDFAVWCHYKYMNSGPGAIAGFYVHERHGNNPDFPRLLGWWSQERNLRLKFDGAELSQVLGAKGFHVSNPPILQYMCLLGSLEVFAETSMKELCNKSRLLTGYLELLIERNLVKGKSSNPDKFVTIVTSKNVQERGCQLSLQFSWPAKDVHDYLSRRGVMSDLRHPDIIRVAPVPLYNSFNDVFRFYQLLLKGIKENS